MNAIDMIKTIHKPMGIDHERGKPISAHSPRPNAVTLSAIQECRDIMSGKITVEWNHPPATKGELKVQLRKMVEEES